MKMPSLVAQSRNPSTREVDTGRSGCPLISALSHSVFSHTQEHDIEKKVGVELQIIPFLRLLQVLKKYLSKLL